MPKTTTGGAGDAGAPFQLPADLTSLTVEQLAELRTQADAELDVVLENRTPENLPEAQRLGKAIKAIKGREKAIADEIAETDAEFEALINDVRPPEATEPGDEGDTTGDDGNAADAVPGGAEPAQPAVAAPTPQAIAASSARPTGGAQTGSRDTGGVGGPRRSLNPSLSSMRTAQPALSSDPGAAPLALTASVGLPGQVEMGGRISQMRQLTDLVEDRARNMADQNGFSRRQVRDGAAAYHRLRGDADHQKPYGGVQVASIAHDFGANRFNETTPRDAVDAYIEGLRSKASGSAFETMVAAGGWCAPSQIRYDFFNIAGECGMIDLPTFGVERGGINFPVSPSLADTFSPALPWYTAFSNATVPWLWTEHSDILAATGSPTKPCIRVPCSTMSDVRLECYGICMTAGNLADNAWPESTRNFLRLLMSAHYHASNARYIASIANLSTAVAGCSATGTGAAAPVLNTAELSAIDYRAKFGMCDTDVIEWVLPEWSLGLVRADLAKRTGVSDFMAVPNSEIARWFDVRGIRVQFVQDYQVRASGQPGAATAITQYPSTLKGLMYAAGTVARGNGMALNLGVVRDSTLNETNDFTAAWLEECHLIARFGHEVREYTMNVCPDGTTGAADLTSCCP